MRTIGEHWPGDAPKGDRQAACDYCGVMWQRSMLRGPDGDGMLYCPDEGDGLSRVELDQENQAAMRRPQPLLDEGGRPPPTLNETEPKILHDKYGNETLGLIEYLNPTFGGT